ncbi:MAG: DASS family sodium-coupled anion symporter [Elusimicrobiota bacterium]
MSRRWSILLGPAAGLILFLALESSSLPHPAKRLAAVLACTIVWWMTECMPLGIGALLAGTACVALKIAPAKVVLAPYADPVIFLFMGSFWLASAMSLHGLDRRIALSILSIPWISSGPRQMIIGVGLVSGFISMWISNTAATAMLLPIVLGLLASFPGRSKSRDLESRTLLMLTFGASIGGLATPIGTPPNLIGRGLLSSLAGVDLGFLDWVKMALPATIASLAFIVWLLSRGLSSDDHGTSSLKKYLEAQRSSLGKWSRGELNTAFALAVAAALWLGVTKMWPEGISAIMAAGLLFLLPDSKGEPTLPWDEAVRIDWGVLLLFGGGLSLGNLLFETKLAEWAGATLVQTLGIRSAFGITGISAFIALITSELANNTASANIGVPSAIALAKSAGVSSALPALAATLASSFGFILPSSTAPNAIVYGTGKVRLRDMIRFGLALDIFGFFLLWWGLPFIVSR